MDKLSAFLEVNTFDEYLDRFEEFHGLAYGKETFHHEMSLLDADEKYTHRQKENLLKAKKRQIAHRLWKEISSLCEEAQEHGVWRPPEPTWPEEVLVKYRFPGGKAGDVNHYLALENAKSLSSLEGEWEAVVPTSKKSALELLCYPLYNPFSNYAVFREEAGEGLRFLLKANRVVGLLERMSYLNYYTGEFRNIRSIKDPDLKNLLERKNREILEARNALYEGLVASGSSHGKWVSEETAYAIVREHFPDARFHYEPAWLFGQHLDIFIPSIQTAIEYMGRQHYEAVGFFRGEEGLRDNQRRDLKKRQACEAKGVSLLYWDFDEPLTAHYFEHHILPFLPKKGNHSP